MLLIRTIILTSFLLSAQAFAHFESDYLDFLNNKTQLTEAEITLAKNYHFVFIAGFLNEMGRKEYFLEVVKALESLSLSATRVYPSSLSTAAENSSWLSEKLNDVYVSGGGKQLISVGHSKGGQENVITHLDHPELVLAGKVAKIIAFQSAIGGNELFERMPLGELLSKYALIPQLRALNPENLKNSIALRLEKLKLENPAAYEKLSHATNYILSNKTPDEMRAILKPIGRLISGESGTLNDGLVATKYMMLQNFGSVLGHLNKVDHLDIVSSKTAGIEQRAKAFAYALVRHTLRSLHGSSKEYEILTREFQQKFFENAHIAANSCKSLYN